MFSAKTYTARRHELRTKIGSGIILLRAIRSRRTIIPTNAYYFRQDSSFRYYFGLNVPSVVGVIDADTGEEALYGDDFHRRGHHLDRTAAHAARNGRRSGRHGDVPDGGA